MGVPALFRWLSRKYPKIISPVIEEEPIIIGDVEQPSVYSNPNPNGELDNLYLDMNGIVHPCSHPENKPAPETEDEMMIEVFRYTERVLNMARPRKVLVIAVDGVAPRAKMNQQRSRRFRSAKDAKIAQEEKERQLREKIDRGEEIDMAIKGKKSWDSNSITPGTPFMDILAQSLRYWVAFKFATDPGWAKLQVIISDATVPGEGEHKIMNFIRSQRSDPEHDPNTSHCIYGLDADLIFLGLATHEPHFRVLREDVFAKDNAQRQLRIADEINMDEATKQKLQEVDQKKPFLWLHVNILREYLEVELNVPRLPFKFDLERAIDDWIFMCFFVGNDFLPHLPSLDVRDNGIDILVGIWKRILPSLKGYVSCDGILDLRGVEKLMANLALQEDDIFRRRHENERRREENFKRRNIEKEQQNALRNQLLKTVAKGKDSAPINPQMNMPLYKVTGENVGGLQMNNNEMVQNISAISKANTANKNVADILKQNLMKKSTSQNPVSAVSIMKGDDDSSSSVSTMTTDSEEPIDVSEDVNKKRSSAAAFGGDSDAETEEDNDTVKLWEPGYKTRYYEQKFHTTDPEEIKRIRREMTVAYVQGVSWVLLYYFQGCASWDYYFPYYYAPFATDFTDIADLDITFKLGTPFRPFEQLMSVLPAASKHNVPEVFWPLMTEPSSEIIDFYPEDFEIDMNGAKMAWQGISLLPFIDEQRLLRVVQAKYELLSDKDMDRNTNKKEILLMGPECKNFNLLKKYLYGDSPRKDLKVTSSSSGVAGTVYPSPVFDPESTIEFTLTTDADHSYCAVPNSKYLYMGYEMPLKIPSKSMILNGYVSHLKLLQQQDKDAIMYNNGRFPRNNRNFDTPLDIDYKAHTGPHGDSIYEPRAGGYKGFVYMYKQEVQRVSQQQSNYNNNYQQASGNDNWNTYGSNGRGYNNNYNNNNSYNNNYNNNNGYNNGYGNSNFSGGYNNGQGNYNNRNYNNSGNSRGRYNNNRNYNNYGNNGYSNNGYNQNNRRG